jgi:hypothetical protein
MMEVRDYHLIFDLNGVLVVIGESQTKSHSVVLRPNLKEFLSTCVKKFMVYIWSSTMKRNFLRHLEIIAEKTSIFLLSSRILDQTFYFRNEHFLSKKLDKFVFHKNLKDFFHLFPGMTFENTLLVDDMFHKNMFDPPYSPIFFKTFYESHIDYNNLLNTIFPYLESLCSFEMWVYTFVELNPSNNITDMATSDLLYEKLNVHCFPK